MKTQTLFWVRLYIGMFDGESFRAIRYRGRKGPSRDRLTAVWVELLALAGRANNGGRLTDGRGRPMPPDALAVQLSRTARELRPALEYFLEDGMLSADGEGYRLTNWLTYQGFAPKSAAERMRHYRARKAANVTHDVTHDVTLSDADVTLSDADVTHGVTDVTRTDIDIDSDSDQDAEKDFLSFSLSQRRALGGALGQGRVLLSDEQMDDLLSRMSMEEFDHYVAAVANEEARGHHYRKKTHYDAILEMATRDRACRGAVAAANEK